MHKQLAHKHMEPWKKRDTLDKNGATQGGRGPSRLGVRNLHTIALASLIKKAATIWGNRSILDRWMQLMYEKGEDIQTINPP